MSWLDAGIGAVGSIASSVVNAAYDNYQQNRQRQWNEQMMDKQNQWSLDMWNRTNQYNDPSAQVERLRNAGLNPMFYGLDGSSAQSFQSAQPLGYERATAPLIGNPVEGALGVVSMENAKADIGLKTQQTRTEVDRQLKLREELSEVKARVKNYLSTADLNDTERRKVEQYMKYADDIYQAQIDKEKSFADLNNAQKDKLQKLLPGEIELQKLSIQDFAHKWKKWEAEISKIVHENALLAKQAKYYLFNFIESGVFGSGLNGFNGYLLYEILNDPDLNPKQKDALKDAFGLNDKKDDDLPEVENKSLFDGKVSQNADPSGNYFGPTF